ncbi:MAG: S-methyl-5'-thioadenosine phosphorylase [Burkholderiaceae bacterium]|jgi:5'-methylthioadenosine phosphorylase|nr:S-methyl-5'-thioadenosine phosphorylase [Burkholderiaceae bacterium]
MGITGIIGGSGLYDIQGLTATRWEKVASPFGEPSDALLFGELDGQPLVFLPRHGRGHRLSPSEINYRANIDALKRVGVDQLISVSAVGSLKEHLRPGIFILVDQYIDRTHGRENSFFGSGCVAHVSLAHPTCARLNQLIGNMAQEAGIETVVGGTYLAMEGPQFSTQAESELYRSWNCDVIGMTNMPEARLAREAEMCYASVAMVTDYDCWHPDHDNVSVSQIIRTLLDNAEKAKTLVRRAVPAFGRDENAASCACRFALEHAIITAPDARDPQLVQRLDAVAGRILNP